jgi:hypothetical protein
VPPGGEGGGGEQEAVHGERTAVLEDESGGQPLLQAGQSTRQFIIPPPDGILTGYKFIISPLGGIRA